MAKRRGGRIKDNVGCTESVGGGSLPGILAACLTSDPAGNLCPRLRLLHSNENGRVDWGWCCGRGRGAERAARSMGRTLPAVLVASVASGPAGSLWSWGLGFGREGGGGELRIVLEGGSLRLWARSPGGQSTWSSG